MSSEDTTDNAAAAAANSLDVSPGVSSDVAAKTNNWVQFEDEAEAKGTAGAEGRAANSNAPAVIKPESVTVQVDKISKSLDPPDINDRRTNEYRGAVIATESVQINLDRSGLSRSITSETPELKLPPGDVRVSEAKSASLKTIDLRDVSNGRNAPSNVISTSVGNIRQGFANGDTIVTLLPVNTKWPWITPARFRPELVPEELMAQGLTVCIIHHILFPLRWRCSSNRGLLETIVVSSQFYGKSLLSSMEYRTSHSKFLLYVHVDVSRNRTRSFEQATASASSYLTLQFIKSYCFNIYHNFIFIICNSLTMLFKRI